MSQGSEAAHTNLDFSCCLVTLFSNVPFLSYQPTDLLSPDAGLVHFTYVPQYTYLDSHVHEDLNLDWGRDITSVYQTPCIFPITIIRWTIMSTIVQLQYDKCECPNWSIGPEWWVAFFFFKPMSLLIYYNSNEQSGSLFPTDIFKAPQIAIWTIL